MQWTLFPLQFKEAYDMYKQQLACFWTVEEIDFSQDRKDMDKLTKEERYMLMQVLAFFAASDSIVNHNIIQQFWAEIEPQEFRAFYTAQLCIESIHSEAYSLLIDTYARDGEKAALFQGIDTNPTIRAKARFCFDWMLPEHSLAQRLVAYGCVEGVLFSASFAVIFYFKKRGVLPGLTFSNELISRDEGLHAKFSCLAYKHLCEPLATSEIHSIIRSAVHAEQEFIKDFLETAVLGLNQADLLGYVEFIADRLLLDLDCPKLYNTTNPLDFMDMQSLERKSNFFETRVSEYSRFDPGDRKFCLDEDF